MTIRIVTDSTCDLPAELAEAHSITVIPTYINLGQESYLDGVELARQEFYERQPQLEVPATTAAPPIGVFADTYKELANEGATAILSIHLATSLSGVLNSARLGAEAVEEVEVTLFDSQQITMGLGFLALRAARLAEKGRSMADIVTHLQDDVGRTHVFAMLDTLEYLRRSGRVGWAEFGVGTLLRIKPLIQVHCSEVHSLEKVRTQGRALKHLLQHVSDLGPLKELALLHTANPEGVRSLRQEAQHLFPEDYEPVSVEVTPTIGVHVGPGALGFACITF